MDGDPNKTADLWNREKPRSAEGRPRVLKEGQHMRESIPRQVEKMSRGPHGERGLEFSRRKKRESFSPLYTP